MDVIRPLAADAARQEGAELVDLEFRREASGWVLRLFIDVEGGVSLDHCRRVSEVVGTLLEVEDPIPHAYTLEVSSPGLTRPLSGPEDWRRAVGDRVRIVTRRPVAGSQAIVGRLVRVEQGAVVVDAGGTEIAIPEDLVARARREVEWPPAAGDPRRTRPKKGRRDAGARAEDESEHGK
jgi:ribosome maturation factor RimP